MNNKDKEFQPREVMRAEGGMWLERYWLYPIFPGEVGKWEEWRKIPGTGLISR
jgi:hypothetical protein